MEDPRLIHEAKKLLDIREIVGKQSNPTILRWFKEIHAATNKYSPQAYTEDSIPWCGLFVAYVCLKANWLELIPDNFLWAHSWVASGQKADVPSLGDILIFTREGGNHVAFYIAEDETTYHILGGNQGDAVSVIRILKTHLIAARRPIWRISQPLSVRPVILNTETTNIKDPGV